MDPVRDYNKEPAQPGTPLEPDELEASPPEFSKLQAARSETAQPKEPTATESEPSELDVRTSSKAGAKPAHPTSELSSTPSHKPGKPSSGTHPTAELHIKPKGRR